jgi:hypothetical protein
MQGQGGVCFDLGQILRWGAGMPQGA